MSARLRRLQAEYERLKVVFAEHDRIRIAEAIGRPPDRYIVEYRVRGLVEEKGRIQARDTHRAEITLGLNYPREMPRCVMLTPVFHPNIDHLAICTEDIGSAGKTLDQTIIFIGEMISFRAYNLQSPRNGDAARWTKENLERLPLETVDLVPPILFNAEAETKITLAAAAAAAAALNEAVTTAMPQPPPERVSTNGALRCANCGREDATAEVRPCSRGHLTCADCRIQCRNCSGSLCVACQVQRCSICNEVFCEDCAIECQTCHRTACLSHVRQCVACKHWNCVEHLGANGRCSTCPEGSNPASTPAVKSGVGA